MIWAETVPKRFRLPILATVRLQELSEVTGLAPAVCLAALIVETERPTQLALVRRYVEMERAAREVLGGS